MTSIIRFICLGILLGSAPFFSMAQDGAGKDDVKKDSSAALSMAEYEKAKTFSIADLDKDSYVKFDNAYILDRNDFGKPYFITGDDGQKKRIDLYKLIRKEGRVELGTMIFYTTEKGKRYSACLPGFKAAPAIWEKYFSDIHAIEKQEPFFVLKLSYVLSRELGFQMYRAKAAAEGKDPDKERETGTYGNDICFPGATMVSMADGSTRRLDAVKAGDAVITVDPATKQTSRVIVKALTIHEPKNYAITRLLLLSTSPGADPRSVFLHARWLEATPNHPMVTSQGEKKVGDLQEGDKIICKDSPTGKSFHHYRVWWKTEEAGGLQRVYNIVAAGGNTLVMNGVVVLQK